MPTRSIRFYVSRDARRSLAEHAGVDAVEIEAVCSHEAGHRLETRVVPISATRRQVVAGEFERWKEGPLCIEGWRIDGGRIDG